MSAPARYLIAKYMPDLFRCEPRNIGVVLWSAAGVAARFVAERPGLGGQVYRKEIPAFVTSPTAYAQWVEYWRNAVEEPTAKSLRGPARTADRTTPEFLDLLAESSRGNYTLTLAGELLDPVTDPQDAADYLFKTLVGAEQKPHHRTIATVCQELIRKHKLDKDDNFKSKHVVDDIVIEGGVKDVMKFSYAYQNGSLRRLYQRVEVGSETGVVGDSVHATVWKFAQVTRQKLGKDDAVSLILMPQQSAAEFQRSPTGALLNSVSRVVNVADKVAADLEFGGLAALSH